MATVTIPSRAMVSHAEKAVSSGPAGPNAGGCGPETEGRVLVVELRSGERLLVGQANGRPVVWQP